MTRRENLLKRLFLFLKHTGDDKVLFEDILWNMMCRWKGLLIYTNFELGVEITGWRILCCILKHFIRVVNLEESASFSLNSELL